MTDTSPETSAETSSPALLRSSVLVGTGTALSRWIKGYRMLRDQEEEQHRASAAAPPTAAESTGLRTR